MPILHWTDAATTWGNAEWSGVATSETDDARKVIELRLESNIASGSDIPIAWDNVPFEPPADAESFIEPVILWGEGGLSTKNGRNTIVGVLNINVYVVAGKGYGPMYTIADEIRDIYNRVEVAGVRFGVPSPARSVVSGSDSRWVQGNISIPFTVDEVLV